MLVIMASNYTNYTMGAMETAHPKKKSKNSEKDNSKINSASIIPWCSQTTSQCKKTGLHRCSVPCWLKPSLPCQPYPDSHMVNPTGSTQREMDLLWSCSHVSWIGMVNPLVKLVWFMIGKIHIFRFQGNSHDPLLNYPSQPAEGNAPFFLDLLVFHGFPNMAGRFSFFWGAIIFGKKGLAAPGLACCIGSRADDLPRWRASRRLGIS